MFVGPLPSPQLLQEYENILPGLAERIVIMAETQAAHRQRMERSVLKIESRNSTLGVIFAFLISVSALAVSGFVISQGKEIGGAILGGTGLVSFVGTFIYGTAQRRKERESRIKQLRES
jgi:uncharacterized membrane protein